MEPVAETAPKKQVPPWDSFEIVFVPFEKPLHKEPIRVAWKGTRGGEQYGDYVKLSYPLSWPMVWAVVGLLVQMCHAVPEAQKAGDV